MCSNVREKACAYSITSSASCLGPRRSRSRASMGEAQGHRPGKDELAHRQRVIVFDLRRKVPVAVEFPRKGLAANQFSGERFTRWSSVTASSFPFPSRTVEWLIYHSTVHCFESESSVDITADAVPELNRFSPVT